jgi:hypothetical protein
MQSAAALSSPRSTITKDPRRLAPDCDMRMPDGRLFADCFDQLAAEYPDAHPMKLREIAILKFAGEKAVAVGAWEDMVRLRNLADRLEGRLRAAKRMVKAAQPEGLRSRLGSKYGGKGG